jgi:hypothetical protein
MQFIQNQMGKKVHKLLQARDIESWCPIQKIERQWTDRKK